jgi:type I restriction enzyme S subunit
MTHRTLDEYLKQTTRTTTKQPATKPRYRITGFYKETEFQETPIGKIPKGWSITKLRNVAKINESRVNMTNLEGDVARIPMELIPDDGIYAKYVLMPINEIKSYVTAKAGDILLAKITPSFENGKQGIVPDDVPHGIALVTTEVYPITPINIERLFLFYLLKLRRYRKLLEWKMTGTTGRRRVPKDALENLLIPLPPLEEQWGVAEVLSALDRAIEATESL